MLLEEGRGNRLRLRDGFKIINGYVRVLINIIKEGGAFHTFCSCLEVKRRIWVVSCAHHLQIIISLRNYVKNMKRKNIN